MVVAAAVSATVVGVTDAERIVAPRVETTNGRTVDTRDCTTGFALYTGVVDVIVETRALTPGVLLAARDDCPVPVALRVWATPERVAVVVPRPEILRDGVIVVRVAAVLGCATPERNVVARPMVFVRALRTVGAIFCATVVSVSGATVSIAPVSTSPTSTSENNNSVSSKDGATSANAGKTNKLLTTKTNLFMANSFLLYTPFYHILGYKTNKKIGARNKFLSFVENKLHLVMRDNV